MLSDLIDDDRLIGKKAAEIVAMLGPGYGRSSDLITPSSEPKTTKTIAPDSEDAFEYLVGSEDGPMPIDDIWLTIYFKNGTVTKVEAR